MHYTGPALAAGVAGFPGCPVVKPFEKRSVPERTHLRILVGDESNECAANMVNRFPGY